MTTATFSSSHRRDRARAVRSRVAAAIMVVLVADGVRSAAARAEQPDDPRGKAIELLKKGSALRKLQTKPSNEEALDLFKRAFAIAPLPEALAQIGMAERALGRWTDAEEHLQEALAKGSTDAWIIANRPALEKGIASAQANVGILVVEGTPAGAQVWVNGAQAGQLPRAEVRVNQGEVMLQVLAPNYSNYQPASKPVIHGGERVSLRVELIDQRVAEIATSGSPGGFPGLPPPPAPQRSLLDSQSFGPASATFFTPMRLVGMGAMVAGLGAIANGARLLASREAGCAEAGPSGFGCLTLTDPPSATPGTLWIGGGLVGVIAGAGLMIFSPVGQQRVTASIGPKNIVIGGTW
jgi:hypothetical protein